jgi:peroxiredoxin
MKSLSASLLLVILTCAFSGCDSAKIENHATGVNAQNAETATNGNDKRQTVNAPTPQPEKPKLPNFELMGLDGKVVSTASLPAGKPTVILFFHPNCEHCQAEARELQKHTDKFANTNFLMVTWDEMRNIRAFMAEYKLTAPIAAYQINSNTLAQTYGQFNLPAVYIYNANRELVQQFNGQAKAEAIREYLR